MASSSMIESLGVSTASGTTGQETQIQYQYKPLKERQIRVLCLHPGQPGSELVGSLDIIDLEEVGDVDMSRFRDVEPDRFGNLPDPMDFIWPKEEAFLTPFSSDSETARTFRLLCLIRQSQYEAIQAWGRVERENAAWQRQIWNGFEDFMPRSIDTGPGVGEYARSEAWPDDQVEELEVLLSKTIWQTRRLLQDVLIEEASTRGAFEAISYAWGSPSRVQNIRIRDEGHVRITESLHAALCHFRSVSRARRLWGDGVCIAQDDTAERNSQVAMMAGILSLASRVLVWLGAESTSDDQAFAYLAGVGARMDFENDLFHANVPSHIFGDATFRKNDAECLCCGRRVRAKSRLGGEVAAAARRLDAKPWFERLWVVQEVVFAKYTELCCGMHRVPFKTVDREGVYSNGMMGISDACWIAHTEHTPNSLLKLLITLSDKLCADPRDRVFAIRGIAGLEQHRALEPDYTLPVAEVFRRMTVERLLRPRTHARPDSSGPEDALPHASLVFALVGTEEGATRRSEPPEREKTSPASSCQNVRGWPSWVPDYDSLSTRSVMKCREYSQDLGVPFISATSSADGQGSFAPMPSTLDWNISEDDPNVLILRGILLGHVAEILPNSRCPQRHMPAPSYEEQADSLVRWYRSCIKFARRIWDDRGRDFLFNVRELVLCADVGTWDYDARIKKCRFVDEGIATDDILHVGPISSPASEGLESLHAVQPFMRDPDGTEELATYDHDRALCVLKTDRAEYLGWIPQTAVVGDAVFLFSGAPRPLLLRKHETSCEWELHGDCWFHGLPPSEVVKLCEEKEELGWVHIV